MPEPASPNLFGTRLKEARSARNMTLSDLGRRVGTAKGYLSLLENGQRPPPPDERLVRAIERALEVPTGWLLGAAQWERTPAGVKRELSQIHSGEVRRGTIVREIKALLHHDGPGKGSNLRELRSLVDRLDPKGAEGGPRGMLPVPLAVEVPLINKVAAGYPTEFTDLGYPARVADEYVRCPDLNDPDAFAARVVGESMLPTYTEGDVVVFSPLKQVRHGSDCFVRLEPDHETTFKRVYFESGARGEEWIRLQPLNSAFEVRVVRREKVAGMYAAVSVIRRVD